MSTVLPPLDAIPPGVVAVDDYLPYARERMSAQAWAYFNGAAADESTLQDNLAAFRRTRLQGRVLRDMAGGDTRLTLLDQVLEHPILLAPVAYQKLAHPAGELATALAASAMRTPMVLSTQASTSLEDVARNAQAPLWFQLYVQPDRAVTEALVRRAETAGYRALMVTVDAPVNGLRNQEQRAGFQLPPGVEAVNLRGMQVQIPHQATAGENPLFGSPLLAAAPTWRDIEWLCSLTSLPVLLKGITAPADALRAHEAGAAGVVVSNHGGRMLDTLPATLDLLPAIVTALAGRMPVLMDGGIRRGTDILKALALGADAVLVGRPYINALATAGAAGVAHVLHLLRAELEVAMVLSGCRNLDEIDESVIWRG